MQIELPLPPLPARPREGHKGTFGTVCVLGGQCAGGRVMIGGPAFAALAALRSGAGLAVLAMPGPVLNAALSVAPSATGVALPVDAHGELQASAGAALLDSLLPGVSCLALGPGLGVGEPQRQLVGRLLAQDRIPVVVDADALNCLAGTPGLQLDLRASTILTPHPGEFRRLARALALEADPESPASRTAAASALSQRLGCVTVLKGHRTVVSDGIRDWTCPAGGPALATAGTGDVLTGLIAGLVAQFGRPDSGWPPSEVASSGPLQGALGTRSRILPLWECARAAVMAHALAADRWAGTHGDAGMLATDLLETLPAVIRDLRRSP